jgi:hypothetical protein
VRAERGETIHELEQGGVGWLEVALDAVTIIQPG